MINSIKIGRRKIGGNNGPFVIAEMSGNHNQSLDRALGIVDAASKAGVDALKIQTYTPDTMTLDIRKKDFVVSNLRSLWRGESLYDLYRKAHTPWEWHKPIFARCRQRGLIAFSTPFDLSSVDFLEKLNAPMYKIASFENTDIPLIRRVAQTGKPMIISTGLATVREIDETVRIARHHGCRDLILLKCTSAYPASPKDANLLTIPDLKKRFHCPVGLSDHTLGIGTSIASVALGAAVIEKHFTLSRDDGGIDSAFSLDPDEMAGLVKETKTAWMALGKVQYGASMAEKPSLRFRRSIFVTENIKAGAVFSQKNIRIIRPGNGLAPKFYDKIIGKPSKMDISRGTPLKKEFIRL